jgi:hypothetical protein
VPVKVTVKFAEPELHIVVFPIRSDVGLGLTVTTALPVISAPMAVHLESLKAVMVYVVVLVGDTLITLGDVAMPVIVTGVVPSV